MKKILGLLVLSSLVLSGTVLFPGQGQAKNTKEPGSVIKGQGLNTLYYLGEDGKRYVFPNDKIYFSWYEDFSQVQEVKLADLYEYPLGGNVKYKPGALLVKIQTDPKVYAVSDNGKLRWVKSEKIAKELYGDNWNKLIDDVPDSFFTDYIVAAAIEDDDDFDPSGEEEQAPTISHGRGLKALIKLRARNHNEKICDRLEKSYSNLQKRMARWGMNIPNLGNDVLASCYGVNDDDSTNNDAPNYGKKITLCHKGETLNVGAPAARAHLRHGDKLGACSGSGTATTTDTTAPAISSIASDPAAYSAVITWTTNEAADSSVQYSANADFANTQTKSSETKVTSHTVALTNLNASTTYYFVVKSKDAAGNLATSSRLYFTTDQPSSDTSAPVISSISVDPSILSAVITWTTNEASDSSVQYGLSANASSTETVSSANDVISHSITLNNLAASTTYYFVVKSKDAAGNLATSSQLHFTTDPAVVADLTAPVISSLNANVSSSSAVITWTTNEAATGKIRYATESLATASTISESEITSLSTSHTFTLSGLSTSTPYFYKVESKDAANNLATSSEATFTTSAE